MMRISIALVDTKRAVFTLNEKFLTLVGNIKKFGLLNPIHVRKKKRGYEIIDGYRRLKAMRMLGCKDIYAFVFRRNEWKK